MPQTSALLAQLFDRLDQWRHLPAYQLERRADIFFAMYMREVMAREMGCDLHELIIQELPLKHAANNQSDKVDYFLSARDRTRVFLVELKTDMRSRCAAQDAYLRQARADGFPRISAGLREIVRATDEKQKYAGLIDAFVQLGFWTVPPDLKDYLHPPRVGLGTRLKDIALTAVQPSVEVVYIQPRPDAPRPAQGDGTRVIDFERFAQHVAAHPDPLSQRFAQSLRTWREPAGARAVLPPEPQR